MLTIDQMKSLNELEMDVYNYLRNNISHLSNMKLKDIADAIHVSPSTVTRTLQKLGYEGFAEFKTEIRLSRPQYVNPHQKNIEYIMDFFNKVNNQAFNLEMNQAIKIIDDSQEILFIGVGVSGTIAKTAAYMFNRKGKKVVPIDDFSFRLKGIYDDKTCAIILTVSGETPEVNAIIQVLHNCGTKIISITNKASSTTAKYSDVAFCYYVPSIKDEFLNNSATQVPVIYILETLVNEIK